MRCAGATGSGQLLYGPMCRRGHGPSGNFSVGQCAAGATGLRATSLWANVPHRETASSRSSWSFPPCVATASMPLISKYSWMSSTSDLFSQKIKTGGGVFCRHLRVRKHDGGQGVMRNGAPTAAIPMKNLHCSCKLNKCCTQKSCSRQVPLEKVDNLRLLLDILHLLDDVKVRGTCSAASSAGASGNNRRTHAPVPNDDQSNSR